MDSEKELEETIRRTEAAIAEQERLIAECREQHERRVELLGPCVMGRDEIAGILEAQDQDFREAYARLRQTVVAEVEPNASALPESRAPRVKPTRQMV